VRGGSIGRRFGVQLWLREEKTVAHKIALERKFLPAHGDPIRIVPLHVPEALIGIEAAAATAAPRFTYRNGSLIQAVEVFTTFWGVGWNKAPASDLIAQINKFFVDILTSPLIDQLAGYSVPGQQIGHGKFPGTINVTNPTPKTSVSDSEIQHMLQHQIVGNPLVPQPNPNALYFVYVQPGT
jgi:hypothetical protein